MLEKYLDSKSLHHAYCFEASDQTTIEVIYDFVARVLKMETKGNLDFRHLKVDTLTIDDARDIKDWAILKSAGGGKKIFVLEFNFITREAQNSLLKLFEEPVADTHFFIVVPDLNMFLSTLRSRFFVVDLEAGEEKIEEARRFLKLDFKKRLDAVSDLLTDIKEEEKSKQDAIVLLNGLESVLSKEIHKPEASDVVFALQEILKSKAFISQKGSSPKIILEHIALITPIF